jgi:diaminopimelate epimerase
MIADRRLGIGCDQILVLRRARNAKNAARYEIWNSDGSPAGQCGNGARCIGLYLRNCGDIADEDFELESPSGKIRLRSCEDGEFEVEMGIPEFEAANVPTTLKPDSGVYPLDSPWGRLELGVASMGNPHALMVVDDISDSTIPAKGAFISTHKAFPEGCNAGFAEIQNRRKIRLRVYERGAGETLACGSGACAAAAILQRQGQVGETVDVFLPGGHLVIKWPGNNRPITMKGPAEHVFRGTLNE